MSTFSDFTELRAPSKLILSDKDYSVTLDNRHLIFLARKFPQFKRYTFLCLGVAYDESVRKRAPTSFFSIS